MRSYLQVLLVALAIPALAGSSERARSTSLVPRSGPDSSVAIRFVGCYLLTVTPGNSRQLRLTLRRVGANWGAQAYGFGARDVAGDSWSWAPIDTTSFRIQWGGIDGAMMFKITRRGSEFDASGIMYQPGTTPRRTQLNSRVRRDLCPPFFI